MDWKCSKNRSYAKTICKIWNHAESFAMLHFLHCKKENLVILMMRVRQDFISEVDFANGAAFCFKCGGDGDNGEMLMSLLDEYFSRMHFHAVEN